MRQWTHHDRVGDHCDASWIARDRARAESRVVQPRQAKFAQLAISNVELIYAPLRRYDDFAWFDIETVSLPPAFTHVFCDGPAVWGRKWAEPMKTNWRAGVVPVLQRRGITFDEILLDDSSDRRCDSSARPGGRWAWKAEFSTLQPAVWSSQIPLLGRRSRRSLAGDRSRTLRRVRALARRRLYGEIRLRK